MTAQELLSALLSIRNSIEATRGEDEDLEFHIDVVPSVTSPGAPALQFAASPRLSAEKGALVQGFIDDESLPSDIETVVIHDD